MLRKYHFYVNEPEDSAREWW